MEYRLQEKFKELWNKYGFWCNQNYKVDSTLFNGPISNKKLEKLIELIGDLDDDFKALYSIYDGEALGIGMFFGFTFLSIDEINIMVTDNSYRGTSTPEKCIKISYYELGWLPIAADGSGNFIGIDYNPDINGVRGQIINNKYLYLISF